MANRARAKGTLAEVAIASYLQREGWPFAERRALSGAADRGDIAGVAGVNQGVMKRAVIEAKNCATLSLPAWLREAEVERRNDNAATAAVWFKQRGVTDPAMWPVAMYGRTYVELLIAAGFQ